MLKFRSVRYILGWSFILGLSLFMGACGGKKSSKSQSGVITDEDTAKKLIDGLASSSKEVEKLQAIQDGCNSGASKEQFLAGFLASSPVHVSADLKDKVDENVAKVLGVEEKDFAGLDKICAESAPKLAALLITSNEEVQAAIGTACYEGGASVNSASIATKLAETEAMKGRLSVDVIQAALQNAGYSDADAAATCAKNPKTAEAAAGAAAAKSSTFDPSKCN
jgi:hypothetical protein